METLAIFFFTKAPGEVKDHTDVLPSPGKAATILSTLPHRTGIHIRAHPLPLDHAPLKVRYPELSQRAR